ncbi:uncharacterized protein [Ptychodera flava]|uniref:uncharacterized protein n=1 Tax=Ptychodera flava TaxID=63121 RepID=UPI00396A43B2
MGSLKIGLNPDTKTPLQEDLKNNIRQELKSCDDLPRFEKFLRSFEIKCQLLFDRGLSVVLLCPSTVTLDILWANYENGSLSQMIQTDVEKNVKLKSVGAGNLRLRTTIEKWRYRQCKLGLDIAHKEQERATARLFWIAMSGLCFIAVLISISFWYIKSHRRSLNNRGTTDDVQKSTTEVTQSNNGDTTSGAECNGEDKTDDELIPGTPATDGSSWNTEPKPIGTKRYIGKKEKVYKRHGGECMRNPIGGT